jgi:hypothetical protein
MEIIKILVEDNYLPDNIVLGYNGENRTAKLELTVDNIVQDATYTIELSNKEIIPLEAVDGFLVAEIKAEVLTTGEIDAQLVWSWNVSERGQEPYVATDKSNVAHWKVLDSISVSDDYEKEHPEIIQQILTDIADLKENGGGGSGKPGYSPIVEMKEVEEGVEITITDVNGPQTALIENGKQGPAGPEGKVGPVGPEGPQGEAGKDGSAGKDGKDGFSPDITTEEIEDGVKITIVKENGTEDVFLYNGKQGPKGEQGIQGIQGPAGPEGPRGETYNLTEDDCQNIATYVYAMFEDGDTLTY